MRLPKNEVLAVVGFALALAFALLLASAVASCDNGSNIPIDPSQCELDPNSYGCPGFDVCAEEGVEECCPECEVCETCETCPEPETVYLCKHYRKECHKTWEHGYNCWFVKEWKPCEKPH